MIDFLKDIDIEKTDKETVEMLKNMGKEIEARMAEYLKGVIDKDAMEKAISEALKSIDQKKELDALKENLSEVKETLVRMKGAFEVKNDKVAVKSLEQQVEEQMKNYITVEKNGAKIVNLKQACQEGKGKQFTLNLVVDTKAATPIMSTGAPHIGAVVDPAVSVDPRSETILRQYSNVAKTNGRSVIYAEFKPGEGDAEWVPEGGLKPLMSGEISEVTIVAGKVSLGAKLTEETLSDLQQIVAEIRAEIINRIGLAEEDGILNGTGEGGQIKGVSGNMPAFSLTSLQIENAGIMDAIHAAYAQIVSTSNMSFRPNVLMMNPLDVVALRREKDNTGRPLNEINALPTGLVLVESTAVEQETIKIGDFNFLNIRDVWELTITFGWVNDDFLNNMVTMLGEKRLLAYIKNQYKTAFVSDTIANIITAIQVKA